MDGRDISEIPTTSSCITVQMQRRIRKRLKQAAAYRANPESKKSASKRYSKANKSRKKERDAIRYREAKLKGRSRYLKEKLKGRNRYLEAKLKRRKLYEQLLRIGALSASHVPTWSRNFTRFTNLALGDVQRQPARKGKNTTFSLGWVKSAEKQALRTKRWNMWITNMLKASIVRHNRAVSRGSNQGATVPTAQAATVLGQVTSIRREVAKLFHRDVANICNIYKETERLSRTDTSVDRLKFLETAYGGRMYHVRSGEGYISAQRPVPFAYDLTNDQTGEKLTTRQCSATCHIPNEWALRLHAVLGLIDRNQPLEAIQSQLLSLETCKNCTPTAYPVCSAGESCEDFVKLLRCVAPHYVGVRSFLRRFYRLRELNFWLCKCDASLAVGDYKALTNLVDYEKPAELRYADDQKDEADIHSETALNMAFARHMEVFSRMCRDWPTQVCPVCRNVVGSKKMRRGPLIPDHDYLARLNTSSLCLYCSNFHKEGKMSPTSFENGMEVDEVPEELAVLNSYERLLIMRAKTFQTIVRLKPMRQSGLDADLVRAIRGSAIHLPLPTQNTLDYAAETLPNFSNLDIIVDSIPASRAVIWRSLVNLEKVNLALSWLKVNNPLYSDVILRSWDATDSLLTSVPLSPTDDLANCNAAASMLLHLGHNAVVEENVTICQLQSDNPSGTGIEHYQLKRVVTQPLPDRLSTLDCLAFPHLFPKGRFGMHYSRKLPVRPNAYQQNRLLHVDPRFRRDQQYLFHLFHNARSRQIESGIYACLKASSKNLSNITAGQLREKMSKNDQELEASLSVMFASVSNTKEYWSRIAGDLYAIDEKFGPATFFLTLSCAEYSWPDMREFLEFANQDVPNVHSSRISSLCSNDPVSVAQQFHRRFNAFLAAVLLKPDGPLGDVEHYFWRLEYQARGAPHIHMKVWVRNSPILGVSSADDVKKFISDHISCHIPDPQKSPQLNAVVNQFQMHRCGKSCYRFVRTKGRIIRRCRFNFPRQESTAVVLHTAEESAISRRKGGSKRLYELVRNHAELFVNDYNPAIALIWGANTDIQYIGESSMVLNRYITGYMTKHEKNSTDDLWMCLQTLSDTDRSMASRLKSLASKSFSSRECGAYEVADRLLGHQLHGGKYGDGVYYLPVGMKSERRRKLKLSSTLAGMADNDTNVFEPNWIDSYYPSRPESLENICLYELFSTHEYLSPSRRPSKMEGVVTLQNGLGYMKRRGHEKVVKTPRFGTKTSSAVERYFHSLLMLFQPWRNETDLLGSYDSYQSAFEASADALKSSITFREAREKMATAIELSQRLRLQSLAERDEALEEAESTNDLLPAIGLPAVVPPETIHDLESKLNADQRELYDKVLCTVQHRQDHLDGLCECAQGGPLRLFATGVGGTGKSFLIDLLRSKICSDFDSTTSVVALAPTGIAAFNISGTTVHRFLKLPVQHGGEKNFWRLTEEDAKLLRMQFADTKLFIFDEVSMISNVMLTYIHLRLQQIYQVPDSSVDISFGGRNILLFGDLLQLPPVRSLLCFRPLTSLQKSSCFGGMILSTNLWNQFDYYELTQNVRQKEDPVYAQMLDRVRIGSPTEDDIRLLEGRIVPDTSNLSTASVYLHRLLCSDEKAVFLLPQNIQVETVNANVLKLLGITAVEVKANDTCRGVAATLKRNGYSGKRPKTSETAGLEETLNLGINARVMLRRNVDVDTGLVNGAIGVVRDLKYNTSGEVTIVDVAFGSNAAVPIKRVSAEYFMRGTTICRSQFPLTLAYAMTIHKSQGLTLDSVLLALDENYRESAMAYVALSRVKRLSAVHLTMFNAASISCDVSAFAEYNRCRRQYNDANRAGRKVLPMLDRCNVLPPRLSALRKRQIRSTVLPTAASKRAKPSTSVPTHSSESAQFVRLSNADGVSCYANAATQVLLRLADFCQLLSQWITAPMATTSRATGGERIIEAISRLKSSDLIASDSWLLRQAVGRPFTLPQQQDSSEFLMKIIQLLPTHLQSLFNVRWRQTLTCTRCKFQKSASEQLLTELTFDPTDGTQSFADLCESFLADSLVEAACDHRCTPDTAHPVNTGHIAHRELIFPPNNRYVVVNLSLFTSQRSIATRMSQRKITHFTSGGVRIAGKLFRTVAAIIHTGSSPKSGHYTAYVKDDDEWLSISDSTAKRHKRFLNNLVNVSALILVSAH